MATFLSLDDTTPASGFVHSTAGCTATGGQVAEQDIAGMAPSAIVFNLANHDPELRGGSWPRPRGRRPAVQRLSPRAASP
ncbi:MAG: hypothetical protein ACYCV4_10255 [Dermatophilaceae bacterium]